MGSVFITDVDDYLAPSQACVNPIFTSDKKPTIDDANEIDMSASQTPVASEGAVVIPRARRRRRGFATSNNHKNDAPAVTMPINSKISSKDTETVAKVSASIADCLACSGCITTAESVLLQEQHSLQALKQRLQAHHQAEQTSKVHVVVTISPASFADLFRHLKLNDTVQHRQQLTTCLSQALKLQAVEEERYSTSTLCSVLDARVPLEWSLQASVDEFCANYQAREKTRTSQTPLVSSSCPAVVCLVEKTRTSVLSYLSKVKSPMALAAAYWQTMLQDKPSNKESSISAEVLPNGNVQMPTNTNPKTLRRKYFHVAIMPCHDKKLEATRPEFRDAIDMALTTRECLDFLHEHVIQLKSANDQSVDGLDYDTNANDLVRVHMLSCSASPIMYAEDFDYSKGASMLTEDNCYLTSQRFAGSDKGDTVMTESDESSTESSVFTLGSGGYATYLFAVASQRLFHYSLSQRQVVWKPILQSTTARVVPSIAHQPQSARVANASRQRRNRNREYYEATLYRHVDENGAVSFAQYKQQEGSASSTLVLRFVIAYGLQSLQRALDGVEQSSSQEDTAVDYLEAMACPSGCLNGGGQISVAARETPSETKQRVHQTQRRFQQAWPSEENASDSVASVTSHLPETELHTSYHVVPPLQHSLGAAAGVAVKDTQW